MTTHVGSRCPTSTLVAPRDSRRRTSVSWSWSGRRSRCTRFFVTLASGVGISPSRPGSPSFAASRWPPEGPVSTCSKSRAACQKALMRSRLRQSIIGHAIVSPTASPPSDSESRAPSRRALQGGECRPPNISDQPGNRVLGHEASGQHPLSVHLCRPEHPVETVEAFDRVL